MSRWTARWPFYTEVQWGGDTIPICAEKGQELELVDEVAEAVNRATNGALTRPKTATGAKVAKGSATRQIVEAEQRVESG